MIYEFKSRATGTVVMNQSSAEWILGVIGKPAGPTGIITVEQIPGAVDALRKAVEEEKRAIREARRESAHRDENDRNRDDRDDDEPSATVTHAQRAWPFIEMLIAAHDAKRDVTWGV
jgi:Sec-independent protein translocase protein TatA